MTEQSTIPGLFCFFIVFVSLGARRVELDCAGPPHWRGSPPFSGANAGSAHSARRAVSVSCFCLFSSLFSNHSYAASHTLTRHSSPRVHPVFFSISLFPVG